VRLTGKVALVTGAARGMGAVEAKTLASEGATVIVADVLNDEGAAVASEINAEGGRAEYVELDVTQEEQWKRATDRAGALGGLDVLVNNAGVQGGRAKFEDTTRAMWEAALTVNGLGVLLGMQAAVPLMQGKGGGTIINISSVAGIVASEHPNRDTTPNVAYYASKAAVRILTKTAAAQLGRFGIRVNSVHPGFILTPMSAVSMEDPVRRQYFLGRIPLGRAGTPEDVAAGVLFLASDESSFVSGSELVIDGGETCKV
jgi:NAD(P)-dependent dehydrogenase (short-subunit alcohol dehydrogenase family)